MSVKRRDKKNRVLRNGESQRADGRYCYKYVDVDGKAKFIYSWKLVDTDKVPQGKRDCVSLREQEKEIQKRLDMNVSKTVAKMKLIDCFEQFINNKVNIKKSTKSNYMSDLNILKGEHFSQKYITNISITEAKQWFKDMSNQRGYYRLHELKILLSAMFEDMIESELVVKNPFKFSLSSIIQKETHERDKLTEEEERILLEYLSSSKYSKYYDEFFFLLNTGLRISEFCGLTLSDIDFEKKIINVNHQLSYINNQYYIETTKSRRGNRIIPITGEVEICLKNIISKREKFDKPYAIDGKTDFLILTRNNTPTNRCTWRERFKAVVDSYNKTHTEQLPTITAHILRHTYCSKLIKKGVPLKVVQYLMGHSDIRITLDTYTHINYNDVINEVLGDMKD